MLSSTNIKPQQLQQASLAFMDSSTTLQGALNSLLALDVIQPSRVGPIKTSLKQYAAILGCADPSECPANAYLKPDRIRNRLIEEKAPHTLGIDGVRNLKNNVSFVLRKAIEHDIVSPFAAELSSWKGTFKSMPRRRENVFVGKYSIDPVPLTLKQEIQEYERWSTAPQNRFRPKRLRKRVISFNQHRVSLLRVAGYLVKCKGVEPESITLSCLVDPSNAIDYVEWRINQQNRYTRGTVLVLSNLLALAKYLAITTQVPDQRLVEGWMRELRDFKATLGTPLKVQNKEKRWLSLNQLEIVGRSIYPLNARRVTEFPRVKRDMERHWSNSSNNSRTFRGYAFGVLQSLLIRLLIRIPLRQRNLREMAWNPSSPEDGQNLYRTSGAWHLRFSGPELKIAEINGDTHSTQYQFPDDLIDLLEEWLYKWRPIVLAGQSSDDGGVAPLQPGQELVFLNSRGRPLTPAQVTELFKTATYKFTGVAVNPHMVRTIFATEYIKATNNFIDAAYMLGDKVQTVIDAYAKLFDEDCGKRASQWISRRLQGEPQGEANQASLPKLIYTRGA